MLSGFKEFLMRGNVVDLAVGVVIGAAFGKIVDALVKGILTPLIGLIVQVPDLSGLKAVVSGSTFMYGDLLNALISFVLVAAAIYFFVVIPMTKMMARLKKPEAVAATPEDIVLLREIRDALKHRG